jgi:hypothetical protein
MHFTTKGQSESWEPIMQYSVTKDYQEYSGTLNFNGAEAIETLSYEINFPSSLGMNASGTLEATQEDQKMFSLGNSGGSSSNRDIHLFRENINEVTITLMWVTSEGEYKETRIFEKAINIGVHIPKFMAFSFHILDLLLIKNIVQNILAPYPYSGCKGYLI